MFYDGNVNLKAAGVKIEYTPEQIEEYIKCMHDPIYFAKTYINIIHPDHGKILFEPWDYQEDIINKCYNNRFVIAKLPRQSGKTTTVAAVLLHAIIFNQDYTVACLAHKQDQAIEILARVKMAYEQLPFWLQQGVVGWAAKSITLENGSTVFAGSTSAGGPRGKTINCVAGDTIITIKNKNGTVQDIHIKDLKPSKGMKVLTSNGFQKFEGIKSSKSNSVITCYFQGTKISCTENHIFFTQRGEVLAKDLETGDMCNGHEFLYSCQSSDEMVYDLINVGNGHEYLTNDLSSHNCVYMDEMAFIPRRMQQKFFTAVYPTITSGKTTKLIITSTPNGLELFYKIWTDSINGKNEFERVEINWWDTPGRDQEWYDQQIRNLGERQVRQEFHTDFLGSNHTLIEGGVLSTLKYIDPVFESHDTRIYEYPQKDKQYFAIVDSSGGVGGDYSTIMVLDISKSPYSVVCTYRNNEISSLVLPEIVNRIASQYNNAWVLVETNNMGQETVNLLHNEYEYENIVSTAKSKRSKELEANEGNNLQLGVFTDKRVKRIGCATLKALVENNQILLNDENIIKELSNFTKKGTSYQAEEGEHDDLVMNLVLFSWFTKQEFFKDLSNTNVWQMMQEKKKKEIEEFNSIIAFYVDNTTEEDTVQYVSDYEFNKFLRE